jgi:peptide/nickel transport system permease protein
VLAARYQHGWVDRVLSLGAFATLSVPEIISGLLLVWFAARTHWFPIDGMRSLAAEGAGPVARALDVGHHLVLPALVVGLVPFASRMRQMRAHLLDVLRLDYVTTARAKGLPEGLVVRRHALPNALNPMITLFGLTLGSLLSGSFVVEYIFNWPGLGTITIEGIRAQDPNLVLGAVLMGATVLVLGNLVADVLLAIADPRISHA